MVNGHNTIQKVMFFQQSICIFTQRFLCLKKKKTNLSVKKNKYFESVTIFDHEYISKCIHFLSVTIEKCLLTLKRF